MRPGGGVKSIVQQDNRFWYVAADGTGYVERTGNSLSRCAGILEQATKERISSEFRAIGTRRGHRIPERHRILLRRQRSDAAHRNRPWWPAQGPNKTCYHRLGDPVFEIPASMNTLRIWPIRLPPGRQIEYRIASLAPTGRSCCIDEYLQVRHCRTAATSSNCAPRAPPTRRTSGRSRSGYVRHGIFRGR